jgi:hypothetical protein
MTKITIPTNHFVGIKHSRSNNEGIPLGFMTPDGTDKAAQKRKDTVRNWTDTWVYNNGTRTKVTDEDAFRELTNELLEGFRVSREVQRSGGWFGSGNVKWRIEDPRGFELEISSHNMAKIMECTTIANGVIEGKCIWGRGGGDNILLPENSQPYTDAVATTIRHTEKISMKDVKVGDLVELPDQEQLVFMGLFRAMCRKSRGYYYYRDDDMDGPILGVLKRYAFKDPKSGHIYTFPSTKIHRMVKKAAKPGKRSDMLVELNKMILNDPDKVHFSANDYRAPVFFSESTKLSVDDVSFEFKEISYNSVVNQNFTKLSQANVYTVEVADQNVMYEADMYYFKQYHKKFMSTPGENDHFNQREKREACITGYKVVVDTENNSVTYFDDKHHQSRWYNSHRARVHRKLRPQGNDDNTLKYYTLVCTHEGQEYTAV